MKRNRLLLALACGIAGVAGIAGLAKSQDQDVTTIIYLTAMVREAQKADPAIKPDDPNNITFTLPGHRAICKTAGSQKSLGWACHYDQQASKPACYSTPAIKGGICFDVFSPRAAEIARNTSLVNRGWMEIANGWVIDVNTTYPSTVLQQGPLIRQKP